MRSGIGNSPKDPVFVSSATASGVSAPAGTSADPSYTIAKPYQEVVDLVVNSSVASTGTTPMTVYGGDYAWSITGTVGTSVQLQTQNRDGTTYTNYLAARTTNDGAATPPGGTLATFGSNAIVRCVVTGTPANLYVSLSRIP